jgi:hypothetical protein
MDVEPLFWNSEPIIDQYLIGPKVTKADLASTALIMGYTFYQGKDNSTILQKGAIQLGSSILGRKTARYMPKSLGKAKNAISFISINYTAHSLAGHKDKMTKLFESTIADIAGGYISPEIAVLR